VSLRGIFTPCSSTTTKLEAGVTCKSEAVFQEKIGNTVGRVDVPTEVDTIAQYSAAMVADAPHPEAARAWLQFIGSEGAFAAFAPYGFQTLRREGGVATAFSTR
jgi:ABC-type molybdate transport system substrate-binding protein